MIGASSLISATYEELFYRILGMHNDDDMQVDPSDVTQSSRDCPYKAGVFPN